MGIAAGGPTFVGGPASVADQMQGWMTEAEVDGFNILDPMPPHTYPAFIAHVLPELRRRGVVWSGYEGTTLREMLQGTGNPRLPSEHPAAAFRDFD
jgi:hypothetical protein